MDEHVLHMHEHVHNTCYEHASHMYHVCYTLIYTDIKTMYAMYSSTYLIGTERTRPFHKPIGKKPTHQT